MRYNTPELTEQEVLQHASSTLQEHLPLHAEGYTCTTADLLKVLLGVAVNRGTIESVCADLVGSPDPQTLRGYLNEQLCVEELPELARRLHAALAAELPPRVRRHAQEVAIDYHDRPYYGKTAQAEGLWVRGQAKDGTTRFSRVATAYLILNGLRVTLALHFVLPADETVSVLETLLKGVKTLGIGVTCLLLDQGRFGIETSYRCAGRVRGWTTAKNPAYRFVLIALAFVLLNVWIHLRWIFTQVPRQGRRWLDTERFQLARFTAFIRRALEQCYGWVQTVTAPAVPRC